MQLAWETHLMDKEARVIACDIGGSGGKLFAVAYDGEKLTLTELHRFANAPVPLGDGLYWDILQIFDGICTGLIKADTERIDSFAVDAFANDFLFLDDTGALLELPHTYRDARTFGMVERMDALITKAELYARTGLQFNRMNTLYQWLSLCLNRPKLLELAENVLFVPDAIGYLLTGRKVAEYSLASVSQAYAIEKRSWDRELLDRIGFPTRLICPIAEPGSIVGELREDIAKRLGIAPFPVRVACGHDTACAVAAVPAQGQGFAYISSGTWSIVGVETDAPVQNAAALRHGLANEGGAGGKIRLLKNVMGLWILQECMRKWRLEHPELTYETLARLAGDAPAFGPVIDPDDESFFEPCDMPAAIASFLVAHGMEVPEGIGGMTRCVLESLAMKYRYTLACISSATMREESCIHIVGGGAKNELLDALTADYTGRTVYAGPCEATAIGNAAIQLIGMGKIHDLRQARASIAASFEGRTFLPHTDQRHLAHYERFLEILRLPTP